MFTTGVRARRQALVPTTLLLLGATLSGCGGGQEDDDAGSMTDIEVNDILHTWEDLACNGSPRNRYYGDLLAEDAVAQAACDDVSGGGLEGAIQLVSVFESQRSIEEFIEERDCFQRFIVFADDWVATIGDEDVAERLASGLDGTICDS